MYVVSENDLYALQNASSKEAVFSNVFALSVGIFVTLLVALLTSPPANPHAFAAFVMLAVMLGLTSPILAVFWWSCRRDHARAAAKILERPSRHLSVVAGQKRP